MMISQECSDCMCWGRMQPGKPCSRDSKKICNIDEFLQMHKHRDVTAYGDFLTMGLLVIIVEGIVILRGG